MTRPFPDAPGPMTGAPGHAEADLLAGYAAGTVQEVAAWSVEAHLTGCARCRAALSAQVDAERLARNRSVLLARAAIGDGGRARRLLCRCGIPDHLLRLLAATPSLRRSWLLSVIGALAVVAGEAAAVRYGWPAAGWPARRAGHPDPEVLAPFLLVAPLLVLAGVAAAFLPMFDPAYRLAVAAPFSGVTLLLARSVSALAAALVPVVAAAFLLPGPGWLPVALLLPSLALCAHGRDRPGPPRCCRHGGDLVGGAGAAAGRDARSAGDRAAERPVRVRRRAVCLRRGAAGPP
jgi:hypothetical protein